MGKLINYSPDPGKPRKRSDEAFITLINQDTQKTNLIQLSVDATKSAFSFFLQVFLEGQIQPTICEQN